jgi:predicted nucleic-acid-binding Zn-ribbon protein
MKDGICPKCNEKKVHLVNHSVVELYIWFFWRTGKEVCQYICTNCGYVEFFVKDESLLPKIAEKYPKVN